MRNVLFIGGRYDGEFREPTPADEYEYAIANGIARHESVGEEEAARRVALWRTAFSAYV